MSDVKRDEFGRLQKGSKLNPEGGVDERRRVMSDASFLKANARNLKKATEELGKLLNENDPAVLLKAIAQIHDIHAKGEDRKFKNKKFLTELRMQKEASEAKDRQDVPNQPSVVVSMKAVD
jgi:hypothetical protein